MCISVFIELKLLLMTLIFLSFYLDLLDAFDKNDRTLVLNLLCNSDIDLGEPIDSHGTTFLHRVAQCIHGRICEMVINYSSYPVDINAKNHDGVTHTSPYGCVIKFRILPHAFEIRRRCQ